MTVERIQYPDDLYATREEGVRAAPMPMPARKPAPLKKTSAAVKTMSIMPPTTVALPEADLLVQGSLCAGVTPEKHAAALETLRSCQVEVK